MQTEAGNQARASVTYVTAKLMPGFAMALFTVLAVRYLPHQAYASFSITWLSALIASSLATGWLRQAHLRFGAVDEPAWLAHRGYGRRTLVVGAPIVIFGLAMLNAEGVGYIGAFLVLTFQASRLNLALARHQAREAPLSTIVVEFARSIVPMAALAIYVTTEWPVTGRGLHVLAVLSAGFSAAEALDRPPRALPSGRRVATLRDAWNYGWPLSIWLAVSLTTQYVDRVMLVAMADSSVAGAYAAAYDIAVRGTTMVLGPLALAAQPAYMRLRAARPTAARGVLVRALAAQLVATAAACIVVIAYYRRLIGVLGIDPGVSVGLFLLLLLSAAGWNSALLAHKPLEYASRTKSLLVAIAGSLVVNVAANAYLIPDYGMLGAALATVLSTLFYLVIVLCMSAWGAQTMRATK